MATMKRRIIYLSDEQWGGLQAQSKRDGTSISELIRSALAPEEETLHLEPGDLSPLGEQILMEQATKAAQPNPYRVLVDATGTNANTEYRREQVRQAQARRDAILKGLSKPKG